NNLLTMRIHPTKILSLAVLLCPLFAFSQQIVLSGTVRSDATGGSIPAVTVKIDGSNAGTFSNDRGHFQLSTDRPLPIKLIFSSIGYELKDVMVTSLAGGSIDVRLVPMSSLGAEVVVSASRIPEKILESPVSIERISAANIQ